MKSLNVICGMPRAGSTLLCNLLSQVDEVFCSDTSPLPVAIASFVHAVSKSEELKGMLIADKDGTEAKITRTVKGIVEDWYHDQPGHVFDKSRGWQFNMRTLKHIAPDAFCVVLVRDPRDVVASVHAADNRMPLLDPAETPAAKTIYTRSEALMMDAGLVGTAILGIEDLIHRGEKGAMFIKYEDFVRDPSKWLGQILERMGLDPFEFDLHNIKNQTKEVDGLYLNKYPHEGRGEVTVDKVGTWSEVLDNDLAEAIRSRYPFFCKYFGY